MFRADGDTNTHTHTQAIFFKYSGRFSPSQILLSVEIVVAIDAFAISTIFYVMLYLSPKTIVCRPNNLWNWIFVFYTKTAHLILCILNYVQGKGWGMEEEGCGRRHCMRRSDSDNNTDNKIKWWATNASGKKTKLTDAEKDTRENSHMIRTINADRSH